MAAVEGDAQWTCGSDGEEEDKDRGRQEVYRGGLERKMMPCFSRRGSFMFDTIAID